MSLVTKEGLKELIVDCLTFKEQEFKMAVLGYRIFGLQLMGEDVTDLDEAFKKLDVSTGIDVNKQFLSATTNPLARKIVETDRTELVKHGYRVALYRVQSELKKLEGYLNSEKLLNLTNSIKDFTDSAGILYRSSLTLNVFVEIVNSQIENYNNFVDDMFKTKVIVYRKPVEFNALIKVPV